MEKKDNYNYTHFRKKFANTEHFAGPKINHKAPDFEARTLDDKTVRLSDYFDKHVVLSCGSITCPAYISKINAMNKLQEQFTDCHFLLLYTRETHPGSHIPPHKLFVDKLKQAKHLRRLEKEKRTIIVDDINGTAHLRYGGLPNFCYVINKNGEVYYRDASEIPVRIEAVLKQLQKQPDHLTADEIDRLSNKFHTPFFTTFRVMHRAGMRSLFDLWRS
ncbi:MAG: hypothetical protein CMF39_00990 [Legionellaceae bacterium]|nr:hypothetical protein [Legionellaceae bacterium]|tara:strand:- start:552 stop:1205 length:654 start_codon:yes stop_codon:yes gene_type:complete